jgi:hypothetical protein
MSRQPSLPSGTALSHFNRRRIPPLLALETPLTRGAIAFYWTNPSRGVSGLPEALQEIVPGPARIISGSEPASGVNWYYGSDKNFIEDLRSTTNAALAGESCV